MFFEIAQEQAIEMQRGAGAFVDGVGAVGVFHEVDGLIELDQAIEEKFGAGVVHVVVAGAVDEEQVAAQAFSEIDGGAVAIAFDVVERQAHVAFLIDRVVEAQVGNGRDGHAHLYRSGERNIRFSVLEPPPLQPQTATRDASA